MKLANQLKYRFALECAAFELHQVYKMAVQEGRLQVADNINVRIRELDELAIKIAEGDVVDTLEMTDEA
jgi:hypothetical protein